ncbi:hypothetical protein BDN72DRAFT_430783 [Pluteus cervinus]|uniref:Uncharacterized protein n=1 Tax=Pluteus cervinus TaxID=181527 RepID=A0ACD3A832_9AGAR|nr:hypothetical protein BDN72DRAFT_430783 [Pluteus cervinus]
MLEWVSYYAFANEGLPGSSWPTFPRVDYPTDTLVLHGIFFGVAFLVFSITLYQYISFSKSFPDGLPDDPKRFFGTLRMAIGAIVVFLFLTAVTGRIHPYEGNSGTDILVRAVLKLSDIFIYTALIILLDHYSQLLKEGIDLFTRRTEPDSSPNSPSQFTEKCYRVFATVVAVVDCAWGGVSAG